MLRQNNLFKRFFLGLALLSLILPTLPSQAAMQSDSYVIYENVHHTFDGPVISAISATVSGLNATVTWTTNVEADSFVIYNTDSGMALASNREQGMSQKDKTAHSVTLSRLSPNTTYYYKVRSTRINGGVTTSAATGSFSIGADPDAVAEEPAASAGGGVIIIDKTDKVAPIITDVRSELIDHQSARISWQTNEPATSFVEYGQTLSFGRVMGEWSSSTEHSVLLENLKPETLYNFRALSSDTWGNVGRSETLSFTLAPEPPETPEPGEEDTAPEDQPLPEEATPEEEPNIIEQAGLSALEFLRRIFPEMTANELTEEDLRNIGSLNELNDFFNAPNFVGQPKIEVKDNEATISWETDKDANSMIAYAPEERFRPGQAEPYYQVVGSSESFTRSHSVTIYGLSPDTVYHFQLRSKPRLGPTAISRDYTFATTLESLAIVSFFSQVINDQEAVFRWVTNKESDSTVRYSPYKDNIAAIDQQKIVKDNVQTVIHEVRLTDLSAGIYYDIDIVSADTEGNTVTETFSRFSTSESDKAPEISHVKADSTVFLDQSNKTQTVISWLTDEPSTSEVHFQEGVHSELGEAAETLSLAENFSKEHVIVITKFKPGIVYSFRVVSIDSGGNKSESRVHTFMTAKQRESIIQIIIRIFEDTFGWVKKLM